MQILQNIKNLFKSDLDKGSIFRDVNLKKELLRTGFITIPLLSKNEIEACLKIFEETDAELSSEKYNTLEVKSYHNRKKVFQSLHEILAPKWEKFFDGYKPIGYNFAIKKASSHKKFDAHVDDIHTDENMYTSVNVWIPLVDVDETNGGLFLVKGSHKLPMPIRGIGLPFPFEKEKQAIETRSIPLKLKAGTAIFFHSKMIHGSPENITNLDRPAIIAGMIPNSAIPITYMRHEEIPCDKVELFEAPLEFFFKVQIGKRPTFAKSLGIYPYTPTPYNRESVLKLLNK